MKSVHNHSRIFAGILLACVAGQGSALTLGRAHSVALLGQLLEVSVSVKLDADESTNGTCYEADVYFGDNRLPSNLVSVTSAQSPQQDSSLVRVTSRINVDEPVVTVYLHAGCQGKTTRKFVLLADLATDVETPGARSSTVRESSTPTVLLGRVAQTVPETAVETTPQQILSTSKKISASKTSSTAKLDPSHTDALRSLQTTRVLSEKRSRLKLVPLDLTEDRDPTLKLSNQLVLAPVEDVQKRTEAAALWRSLNATAQDILRDEARMRSLESDLNAQRELTSKNGRSLQELSARLEQVEAQRYANPLVYVLFALLASCVGILVYVGRSWRLSGQGASPWWKVARDEVADSQESAAAELVARTPPTTSIQPERIEDAVSTFSPPSSRLIVRTGVSEVDIDLNLEDSDSERHTSMPLQSQAEQVAMPAPISVRGLSQDFAHSVTATLRSINMQEVLDVRQQADFFLTLGQHAEAIGVLKDSIHESGESNPLVYLDLLKALHTLSRKAEFDYYRDDFNYRFTGCVPPFMEFNHGGDWLEDYPGVLQEISGLWPRVESLECIENYLVRAVDNSQQQHFDLNAYRDLLTLHGVASRIVSDSETGPAPFSTAKTDIPVDVEAMVQDPQARVSTLDVERATSMFSTGTTGLSAFPVDLDLSEPVADSDAHDAWNLSPKKGHP
jgi:hypothetical protein